MFEFVADGTVLQLDRGWVQTETSNIIDFRKGYSIESKLSDIDPLDSFVGNYCIIQYNKSIKNWHIYKDSNRGFPVYYSGSIITNINTGLKPIHPDHWLNMHNGSVIKCGPFNGYRLVEKEKLPLDEIINRVEFELLDYILKFVKYNDDELIWNPTFGYDCTALKAILDYNNIPHVCTDWLDTGGKSPQKCKDELFLAVRNDHWGYHQLGLEDKSQTILTGYYGDVFLMRGGMYVHYYLKQYGIDFTQEILSTQSYEQKFIKERYIQTNKFANAKGNPDNEKIANAMLNDWQMWGINNTATILPYKNIKLLELSFRLKLEDALKQGLNAIIQHRIIEKCNPALLATITASKNEK